MQNFRSLAAFGRPAAAYPPFVLLFGLQLTKVEHPWFRAKSSQEDHVTHSRAATQRRTADSILVPRILGAIPKKKVSAKAKYIVPVSSRL